MQSFPSKDVITVSCSPMNSVLNSLSSSRAQQSEAKSHSCNNRMGLRAGANPNFTS
ncbi:hypothetical protein MKW92_038339 [Papaver armeniacum]|nr:hypothetical protein MKW92_038339 [Papaver armeniacum]